MVAFPVRLSLVLIVIPLLIAAGPHPAQAQTVQVLERFIPEAGRIVDAAMIADGHVALCYPDAGHIADYTFDGTLYQHIAREGGQKLRFQPTACAARGSAGLLVFDEAEHKLFTMAPDGNIETGVDLAYSAEAGSSLALARVSDLTRGADGTLFALLPQRNVLAGFDPEGRMLSRLDLAQALPFKHAIYSRAQVLSDGSLFVLDYHQGGVVYRHGTQGQYRRLSLGTPAGLGAAPQVQDFAADDVGNVMLATYNPEAPLMLLTPGAQGYDGHAVDLQLMRAPHRISIRFSRGTFILWIREKPSVVLFRLQ